MRLCAAQLRPVAGDLPSNRAKHLDLIALAAHERAAVVMFPELSLTGYEPSLARSLAMDAHDPRLHALQHASDLHGILVGVGLPLSSPEGVQIGMVWFAPHATPRTYAKQALHADERTTFVPGHQQLLLEVDGARLAPAICFESLQMEHADRAAELGAHAYLTSVAKASGNAAIAMVHYRAVARKHGMFVLMANAIGLSDDVTNVGGSAAWDDNGTLLAQMGRDTEGVVTLDTRTRTASVRAIATN